MVDARKPWLVAALGCLYDTLCVDDATHRADGDRCSMAIRFNYLYGPRNGAVLDVPESERNVQSLGVVAASLRGQRPLLPQMGFSSRQRELSHAFNRTRSRAGGETRSRALLTMILLRRRRSIAPRTRQYIDSDSRLPSGRGCQDMTLRNVGQYSRIL